MVATRQRAAAVQLAYARTQLAAGNRTWATPDVLPLQAFTRRERIPAVRHLSAVEEWALWRVAAEECAGGLDLLSAPELGDVLRTVSSLQHDWGTPAMSVALPEGEIYLQAQRAYARHRALLGADDSQSWRRDSAAFSGAVWLAHAEQYGAATLRLLQARGAVSYQPVAVGVATTMVCAAPNLSAEYEAMAAWCRAQLQRNPAVRLLLVVPALSQDRAEIERMLAECLQQESLANGDSTVPLYAVEGGAPLAEAPLVAVALTLLQLAVATRPFAELSLLLRSSSLPADTAAARLALELRLRRKGITHADLRALAALARSAGSAGTVALQQAAAEVERWPVRGRAAEWAARFAALWALLGWPGSVPLDSREQQRRLRLDELLAEFATLDDALGPMSAADAVQWLQAWTSRAQFEPSSGDVPVTVTASVDDPLVQYDGIWVAGLTAAAWPQPAEETGFVSAAALQAAGRLAASADGRLQAARTAMFRWQCCTRELVYSWARLDGDAEAEASPLLAPLSTAAVTKAAAEPPRTGLLQLAAEMEPCAADVARSWPAGALARGGAGLLQAQSQCPFKAAALWRLDCSLLESPVAGVTAQLHGRIVHSALQRLWQELQDAAGLHSQPVAAWQPRVAVAVRAAIQDLASGEAPQVPALAWQVEQQRCQQLLLEALELERGRPKFRTLQLEQESPLWLDDLQLRVRVDRVDLQADADGTERQVLIDYKTGKRQGTDWESMRPQQVQLQTYALLSDSLCVATSLHLHRGTARWSGIADSAGRVPGIRAAGDWQALRARWRLMLHTLARDFVAGQATVDPLKKACDHCGLQLLCRVNAEVYADSVAGALPDGAGDSDADGEHD